MEAKSYVLNLHARRILFLVGLALIFIFFQGGAAQTILLGVAVFAFIVIFLHKDELDFTDELLEASLSSSISLEKLQELLYREDVYGHGERVNSVVKKRYQEYLERSKNLMQGVAEILLAVDYFFQQKQVSPRLFRTKDKLKELLRLAIPEYPIPFYAQTFADYVLTSPIYSQDYIKSVQFILDAWQANHDISDFSYLKKVFNELVINRERDHPVTEHAYEEIIRILEEKTGERIVQV